MLTSTPTSAASVADARSGVGPMLVSPIRASAIRPPSRRTAAATADRDVNLTPAADGQACVVMTGPAVPLNTFGPEKLIAYEGGIKSQFFDRRVTLNLAGFYYDYSDIQVRSIPTLGVSLVENAAAATIKGIEASGSAEEAAGRAATPRR